MDQPKHPHSILREFPSISEYTTGKPIEWGQGFLIYSTFMEEGYHNYWIGIVRLRNGHYHPVFKRVSQMWLRSSGQTILNSPYIYVHWNDHSEIEEWEAIQDKHELED
ncbi:hypothetical protein [Candidatus Formimonas warabiya]|uniref:Uncharacterized protein n=1 Tax=Formimonas warabiya TaxID=1761012 RepID=A0A3G1KQ23_FORW1|nr:hypothetical protein [Candidatus Formimonas warabiya]ATW24564.1 hypothetical protein DCMF_06995 [Candidatus Formimonas warabiya]